MIRRKSYGVDIKPTASSLVDNCLEELSINGFSVLENVLDPADLQESRKRIDAVYEIQKNNFGEENLREINEENLVRCPLVYDEFFVRIATNPKVLEVVKRILGEYFILHLQNGIINRPAEEHHQSSWHRDLPYQNFVISKPISISALFCIDDFTNKSGSTLVLPYSHRSRADSFCRIFRKIRYSNTYKCRISHII